MVFLVSARGGQDGHCSDDLALDEPELSPRELAVRFTDRVCGTPGVRRTIR